jgi:hypothetical protein
MDPAFLNLCAIGIAILLAFVVVFSQLQLFTISKTLKEVRDELVSAREGRTEKKTSAASQ